MVLKQSADPRAKAFREKLVQDVEALASTAASKAQDVSGAELSVDTCMQHGFCIQCRDADSACFQPHLGCPLHDGKYRMHIPCFLEHAG